MLHDLIHSFRVWRERRAILALALRTSRATGEIPYPRLAAEALSEARELAEKNVTRRSRIPSPPGEES